MAVETDAERALFFNPDEFGTEALYTPKTGGDPRPVLGIFEASGSDWNPNRFPGGSPISMQQSAHVVSTAISFTCLTSALTAGGRRGDILVIDGDTYRVFKKTPDGAGMTTLTLEETLPADEGK